MVSTARANLSVGPPYDAGVYFDGSFDLLEARIEANSPYLAELDGVWSRHLVAAIHELPPVPPELLPS
jgi:putative proteasome-type protease